MSNIEGDLHERLSRMDLSDFGDDTAKRHKRRSSSRHSRKRSLEEGPGSESRNSSKGSSHGGSKAKKHRKRGSKTKENDGYQPTRVPIPDPAHMSGALAPGDDVGTDLTRRGDLVRDSSAANAWKVHPEYEDNTISKVNVKRAGEIDDQEDNAVGNKSTHTGITGRERSKALSDKKAHNFHKKVQREKKKFIKIYKNSEEGKQAAVQSDGAKDKN